MRLFTNVLEVVFSETRIAPAQLPLVSLYKLGLENPQSTSILTGWIQRF
jgi:hypothetical protein